MTEYICEFFDKLKPSEQYDILRFARAYMRVRELHVDKTLSPLTHKYYAELEKKLDDYLKE